MKTMKTIAVEGLVAGALGGGAVAGWFLLHDVIARRPFFTPSLLGAVVFHGQRDGSAVTVSGRLVLEYSLLHWAVFMVFGVAAAALLAAADRQPSLLIVFVMLTCCFEVAALVLIAVLAEWLFEALAWWTVTLANVLAAASMLVFLGRRHRRAWRENRALVWND
ncbi:MAG TPA: hypothetical protein VJX92_25320 [Methylomirabilota bacterium]|nr:hypothetical protein [Methylomirabilota bacterium]